MTTALYIIAMLGLSLVFLGIAGLCAYAIWMIHIGKWMPPK